jgi:hypothetical protein
VKKVLRYSVAGLAVALAYLGWVAWSRHSANRDMEREGQQREAAKYKELVPADTTLKITQFYAAKQEVHRDESVLVCFGVENASSVRIEPPIEQLIPLPSKCFPFAPQHTTALKLVADGANGAEVTASLTIKVR